MLPRGFYDEPELFAEAVGFRGEGLGRWRRGGMMGVGGGGWGVGGEKDVRSGAEEEDHAVFVPG